MVKDLFKKAIKIMLENKEFDKLLAYDCNKKEKEKIILDYETVKGIASKMEIDDFPFIPLLMGLRSYIVFADIVSYMALLEDKLLSEK